MAPLTRAFALTFLALGVAGTATVRADAVTERSVKAAFLYKFPGFVQWPASAPAAPDAPIVIGVMGAEELAGELEAITAGRKVENRPIVVQRLRDPQAINGVHVVFLGAREKGRMETVARAARSAGALLVTEWEGALREGAAVNFVLVDGRVRFDIAVAAAEKSGLRLSSRLLAVAHQVSGAAP